MIPLFDLKRLLQKHELELNLVFNECLKEAKFINGPQVKILERQLCEYLGVSNTIGVSSGTDALLSIFMSLGTKEGEEILVTPFTFAASATSIMRAGFRPVFADLAKGSFVPSIEEYEAALTPKTKGILAVHLFGEPNNLTELREFCDAKDLFLIEDCAQAMGTKWRDKHVGNVGDASAFSFFPAKNLGCFGDGGCITTNDPELATKLKMIRAHGSATKYNHEILGGNFRLDTLQAAILSVLLPQLDGWVVKRKEHAEYYAENLSDIEPLILPQHVRGHSWNQYTIRTNKRDELKKYLDDRSIGNAVYYPKALQHQKVFQNRWILSTQHLPEAEKRCTEVLSLPVYPGLTREEQDIVIATIREFYKRCV